MVVVCVPYTFLHCTFTIDVDCVFFVLLSYLSSVLQSAQHTLRLKLVMSTEKILHLQKNIFFSSIVFNRFLKERSCHFPENWNHMILVISELQKLLKTWLYIWANSLADYQSAIHYVSTECFPLDAPES